MWTIYDIEVLMHHHCSMQPWPRGRSNPYEVSVEKLRKHDLMSSTGHVTPRGCAFIGMLQKTPVPIDGFCDPRVTEEVA
jgi:hypothetical protein